MLFQTLLETYKTHKEYRTQHERTTYVCMQRLYVFVTSMINYLDLRLEFDEDGKLYTRLCDKRDDFDFAIVNFPYLSSNIL